MELVFAVPAALSIPSSAQNGLSNPEEGAHINQSHGLGVNFASYEPL